MCTKLKCICLMFATIITFSFAPSIAFASDAQPPPSHPQATEWDSILGSYYSSSDERSGGSMVIAEEDSVVVDGSVIDFAALIPTFSTQTHSKQKLLDMCEKLKSGVKLSAVIHNDGYFFTITKNNNGDSTGYAMLKEDSLTVQELGELNDYTDKELALDEGLKQALQNSKLELSTTRAVFCTIDNFVVGTLLYDGENEYFVPSVESMESMGLVTVGELYPVADIVDLIETNIATIFPVNEVDEGGRPNTGAGTVATAPPIQSEAPQVASGMRSTQGILLLVALVCVAAAVLCVVALLKRKRKQ